MISADDQKKMVNGEYEPEIKMSIDLLKRLGEAFDAEKMVKADIVHVSTNLPTDMLVKMSEGVSQVRTPCILSVV